MNSIPQFTLSGAKRLLLHTYARATVDVVKPVGFDWSDQKSARNRAKHGVSFEEAATVFDDDLAVTRDDPDHSVDERREIIIGHSDLPRLLFVSFTERNDVIRLISARQATKSEQKLYEEAIKRSR